MIIIDPANPAIKMDSANPTWKLGTLQKGLVLDMPLMAKYHNPGTDRLTDRTPYENHGANNGSEVDTDHTTFVTTNSDYVDCGNDSSLDITDAITIEMWMNPTDANITYHQVVGNGFEFGVQGIRIGYISGEFRGYWEDSINGLQYIQTNTKPVVGQWSHIVTIMGDGYVKMYLDNVLQDDVKVFNEIVRVGTPDTYIGSLDDTFQYFDGDISNVRIYNRALTPAEVKLLYDKGRK